MANIVKPSGINQLWASGGTKVDPGLVKSNIGWVVELPPYQYQNWLDNRQDTFIAHINQHGIPEWDSETEYQGNLSYTQGSDGYIYKCLTTNTNFNPANPLNSLYWVRAFESYGSVAVVQNQLTQHLTNYSTLAGIGNPVLARSNLSVWSRTESDARYAALAGSSSQAFSVANATLSTHAVPLGQLNSLLLQATESSLGVVRIATNGDTETGTDDTKAITPLKASTVFLKKSGNLAGLANIATARTNLGLGTVSTLNQVDVLLSANNLSDITSASSARTNLGLTSTATQPESYFLRTANNLSDVVPATARSNLGLSDLATTSSSAVLFKADNLAGLGNVATARNNLGLGSAAVQPVTTFLQRANNLNDLTNVQAARNNLGLGSAAVMSTPGVVVGSLNHQSSNAQNGWEQRPNGLMEKWGASSIQFAGVKYTEIAYGGPAFTSVLNIQLTYTNRTDNDGDSCWVESYNNSTFVVGQAGGGNQGFAQGVFWRVIGTYN